MKKKSAFEKMVLQKRKSKGIIHQGNRMLVSINIVGSTGPIRFVVNEEDTVSFTIETALNYYARQGRLPLLDFDPTTFLLYSANTGFDALNPLETIGSYGVRNFVLCRKQVCSSNAEPNKTGLVSQKSHGGRSWKAWFNKPFGLKISSH